MNSSQIPCCEISDDLLDPDLAARLIETVQWVPVYFINRRERFNSDHLDCHWYYPLVFTPSPADDLGPVQLAFDDLDPSLDAIKQCWDVIRRSHDVPVELYDCTLSSNSFGTEGRAHYDLGPNERAMRHRHVTALVYCAKEWHINWGGETIVFDENEHVIGAALPKPGRVVKILGDPMHVGRGVSRICPSDRRVLAFKYLLPEHTDGPSS